MTTNQYVKQRDEAVLKNDLKGFAEFLERAAKANVIDWGLYLHFITSPEIQQQATINKMACNIIGMDPERVKEAKTWLKAHNMSPSLYAAQRNKK